MISKPTSKRKRKKAHTQMIQVYIPMTLNDFVAHDYLMRSNLV